MSSHITDNFEPNTSAAEPENIINQKKNSQQKRSMYIVMEFAELGDLQKLINEQKSKRKYFSEKEIWQIAW